MTDLDVRPSRTGASRAGRQPPRPSSKPAGESSAPAWVPLVVAGVRAAVTDVLVALVAVETLVLVAWAADSRAGSSASQAARVGACLYLVALHTRVHAGAAVVGLPPLLITLACALLVARSCSTLARDRLFATRRPKATAPSSRQCAGVVAAVAVPYSLLAVVVARVVDQPTLYPSPLTALVGGLAVAGAGGVCGVARQRRAQGLAPWRDQLPTPARTVLSSCGAALLALLGAATVLLLGALIAHHQLAGQLSHALSPGVVGGTAFTLLQLTLAPTLVIASGAWLAGPGFAVGTATSVTPWTTSLGPVPAVPVLAALPSGQPHVGALVLLVPVAAGALAGWRVLRQVGGHSSWRPSALVVGAAALGGLLACLASYAASGPVGPGRLLAVGPCGWRVGLALLGELALGGLLVTGSRWVWLTDRVRRLRAR